MEFPFGHHHHRHSPERDEPHPPPHPPPGHHPHGPPVNEFPAPPPPWSSGPAHHVSHEHGPGFAPPPPFPTEPGFHPHHPHHYPPYPAPAPVPVPAHHGSPENSRLPPSLVGQRTVKIFCKAAENFSLSIRDGKVVLARANPRDEYQHWIKDMRYSTKVKDEEGLPSFALVNKVTGEAVKHSVGATHPVRLVKYNPDYLDESLLWTESYDTGENFRCIRMANNIRLNFDAFHGDEDHGGVHDGTTVVLWEWLEGKNQRWKIVPYCKSTRLPFSINSSNLIFNYHIQIHAFI